MKGSTNVQKTFRTILIDGYSIDNDENPNMYSFESWRDKIIDNTNKQCLIVQDDEMQKLSTIFEIRKVPACLVQMTKMMCGCDSECTEASLSLTKFDTSCVIYNLKDSFLSLEYQNCDILSRWIADGKLQKSKLNSSIFADIFTQFDNLCDNVPKSFEKLQCILYTFKDSCKESNFCSEFKLTNYLRTECENENYDKQIDLIMNPLGSYAYDNTVRKFNRETRSILNSQEHGNKTLEFESFHKKIALENNSVASSSFKNIQSPMIIFLVLSAGCLGYKYQNYFNANNKIIVGFFFSVLCFLYLNMFIFNL